MLENDISEIATENLVESNVEIDTKMQELEEKVSKLLSGNYGNPEQERVHAQVVDNFSVDLPEGVTLPEPVQLNENIDYSYNGYSDAEQEPDVAPSWKWAGGSVQSSGATAADYRSKKEKSTNSRVREIDLPVGFMKATLLVGINARSGEFGQSNPQQVVFNVAAPAQLPNKIKLNLTGCFVVANAHGDLSAKRIEALPVSMNCLTKDGKYKIISNNIKGFVQDADGKRGLDARVVSRARHLLASTLFAKTVTGVGKVIAAQGQTQINTPLLSASTQDNSEIAKSALAGGFAEGFDDLGDYLLDLAKQMSPTLEHGAGKNVLIWVADASTLKIEEVKK